MSTSSGQPLKGGVPGTFPYARNSDSGTNANWLHIDYYSRYFQITADEAKKRILMALSINPTFLDEVTSRGDLYGPFWISTTTIFLLFMVTSLSAIFSSWKAADVPGSEVMIDFGKVSLAAMLVYGYVFGASTALWAALHWSSGSPPITWLEATDLIGYSLSPVIPALIACLLPSNAIRWLVIIAAASISAVFVIKNAWPKLKESAIGQEQSIIILGAWLVFHVVVFFAIRVAFLTMPAIGKPGSTHPAPVNPAPVPSPSVSPPPIPRSSA